MITFINPLVFWRVCDRSARELGFSFLSNIIVECLSHVRIFIFNVLLTLFLGPTPTVSRCAVFAVHLLSEQGHFYYCVIWNRWLWSLIVIGWAMFKDVVKYTCVKTHLWPIYVVVQLALLRLCVSTSVCYLTIILLNYIAWRKDYNLFSINWNFVAVCLFCQLCNKYFIKAVVYSDFRKAKELHVLN